MHLHMSQISATFVAVNQFNEYSYGKTKEAYCDILRRPGERPEEKAEIIQDQQDHQGENPYSALARHCTQRERTFLRGCRQEIRYVIELGEDGCKDVCAGRSGASAEDKQESQFRYSTDKSGWENRGADNKDSLRSRPRRPWKMDSEASGRPLPYRIGGTGKQGHHQARIKKNKLRPHRNTYWCIPAKASGDYVGIFS